MAIVDANTADLTPEQRQALAAEAGAGQAPPPSAEAVAAAQPRGAARRKVQDVEVAAIAPHAANPRVPQGVPAGSIQINGEWFQPLARSGLVVDEETGEPLKDGDGQVRHKAPFAFVNGALVVQEEGLRYVAEGQGVGRGLNEDDLDDIPGQPPRP